MRSEPWGFIAKLAQTDSPGIAQLNRRRTTYIALHKKDKVFLHCTGIPFMASQNGALALDFI